MDATRKQAAFKNPWFLPLAFVLAGLCLLPVDVRIAASFLGKRSSTFSDFLEICEFFGHGFGASFIVIAAVALDPYGLRNLLPLMISSLGSGMTANLLKLCVHRTRPRDFDLVNGTVWETFVRASGDARAMQSMPSSHTATAVGLAFLLAALYPRGRYVFWILAALVGMQRIATNAHFPSDVCAGAAVGSIIGILCTRIEKNNRKVCGDELINHVND
jgi:membrane-associated phospholipid phosphatase